MDKNKEMNIKLRQVPSSYHENDNRVLNNSELLILWNLISISELLSLWNLISISELLSLWNLIARVRESRAEVKIKAETKY